MGIVSKYLLVSAAVGAVLAVSDAHATDFNSAIAHAYASHPQLKAEQENLGSARAAMWEAYTGYLPDVRADMSFGRERFEFPGIPQQYRAANSKSLNVSQPIFNATALARMQTAKSRLKSAESRVRATEQTVLLNAITAYVRVAETQSLLKVNRDHVALLSKNTGSTRDRLKAQDATISDLALTESRLARARSQLRSAQSDANEARDTYRREIGLEPTGETLPPLPTGMPETADELAAMAEHNPNLQVAHEEENAAHSVVHENMAEMLPKVSLDGTMERRGDLASAIPPYSLSEDKLVVHISIPIFQQGAEYTRISQARHQAARARYQADDTRRAVRVDTEHAWESYEAARDRLEMNEASVKSATKALNGMQQEFGAGMRTVFDMLDTQEEIFASRQDFMRTKADYIVNSYQLLASVGELTPGRLNLSEETLAEMEKASQPAEAKPDSVNIVPSKPALRTDVDTTTLPVPAKEPDAAPATALPPLASPADAAPRPEPDDKAAEEKASGAVTGNGTLHVPATR